MDGSSKAKDMLLACGVAGLYTFHSSSGEQEHSLGLCGCGHGEQLAVPLGGDGPSSLTVVKLGNSYCGVSYVSLGQAFTRFSLVLYRVAR